MQTECTYLHVYCTMGKVVKDECLWNFELQTDLALPAHLKWSMLGAPAIIMDPARKMEMRLPEQKLVEIKNLIQKWLILSRQAGGKWDKHYC